MTARNAALGAFNYEIESSFCENVTTFATRLLPVDRIDVTGLLQPKLNYNPLKQRPHDGEQDIRGPYEGSFEVTFMLAGHGGTAAGALTATNLATFLGHVIGTISTAGDGGTVQSATDANTFVTTGATFAAGEMLRVGALGDGRGEGQFRVTSAASPNIELLQNLSATPNAADVVYAAIQLYPSETPGTIETIQSLRCQVMSANGNWNCHGCYPTAISFEGLNAGELPRVKVTMGVSYWTTDNDTFPDATATAAKVPAPVSCGSFFLAPVGTATQGHYNIRQFGLEIQHEVVPVRGPGGVFDRQTIVGARRIRSQAKVTATFDAEASGTTTWDTIYTTDETSLNYYQILNTLSCADGKAIGFFFPKCKIIDPRPTQIELDGLNRVTATFEALTGGTTTTDLTASNWRLALG